MSNDKELLPTSTQIDLLDKLAREWIASGPGIAIQFAGSVGRRKQCNWNDAMVSALCERGLNARVVGWNIVVER